MLDAAQSWEVLRNAEIICSEEAVRASVTRLAQEITADLRDSNPLLLCVMGGGVVFAGQLLPLLRFPLEFDFIHVTRYRNTTRGGEVEWKVLPQTSVAGRTVLIVDDILDEGTTLLAIRERLLADGAAGFYSAVFADKQLSKPKPIHAQYVGLQVPDRYVFGFGMDVEGFWRNLPAIYAMAD